MIMIRYDLAKYIEADSKNFPGARGGIYKIQRLFVCQSYL